MKLFVVASVCCLAYVNPVAAADVGGESGNGGDVCEDRVKSIRNDLKSWIEIGGADALILPSGLELSTYKASMTAAIREASISCTALPLKIGQAEKTCVNFLDSDSKHRIVCNTNGLNNTTQSDQYVLVHHEFAGVAGLEVNDGEDSNYVISRQISGFLVDQVQKKLAVRPAFPPGSNKCLLLPPTKMNSGSIVCSSGWGVTLAGYLFSQTPCYKDAALAQAEIDRSPVCHAPSLNKGRCSLLPPGRMEKSSRTCTNSWGVTYDGYFISETPCYKSADAAYDAMVGSTICK